MFSLDPHANSINKGTDATYGTPHDLIRFCVGFCGAICGMCTDDAEGLGTAHTCMRTENTLPICSLDYSASRRLTLYNRFENSELIALTPAKDAPSKTHSTLK